MPIPREWDREVRWALLMLAGITALAALLRFAALTSEELWFDEVFSVVVASQDIAELLRRALADQTNPPGFYLVLWGWAQIGSVELGWLRALPALAGTLTVPLVAMLGRVLGLRWGAALLAALLAAVSPLSLAMSLEVRAYAPLALVATLAVALGSRLAQNASPSRGDIAVLALVQLGLVSLHYFGALVVVAILVATWWAQRAGLRTMLVAALPAGAALATWIGLVLASATGPRIGGNAAWIQSPGLGSLRGFASQAIGTFDTDWGSAIVAAALIAAAIAATRRALVTADSTADSTTGDSAHDAARFRARWLLTATLVPLALVFVVSATGPRSLWLARYLIIVLPSLWLLVADAACALRGTVRTAAVAALAIWALFAGPLAERARVRKPAWSRVVRSLAGGAPVTLCVNEPFVGLTLQYYALESHLPLRVLDFSACATTQTGAHALLRPETGSSLELLVRRGALVGPARALGTALPDADLRTLSWPRR